MCSLGNIVRGIAALLKTRRPNITRALLKRKTNTKKIWGTETIELLTFNFYGFSCLLGFYSLYSSLVVATIRIFSYEFFNKVNDGARDRVLPCRREI